MKSRHRTFLYGFLIWLGLSLTGAIMLTRAELARPFSRQITLSFGTLVVILAVWWTVAALQLISPLFLPPPGQVLQKLMVIAGPQGPRKWLGTKDD